MFKTRSKKILASAAKKVRLLILDVDGVLTDGSIVLDNNGNEMKLFNVRDGHGIKMFINTGLLVALITGRKSKVVEIRARELGITEVFQKSLNKMESYEVLINKYGIKDSEVAYVGDDIVDLPIMQRVGLPVAVADAIHEIHGYALMITENRGGRGAVREVTDYILRKKGLWDSAIHGYVKT